MRLFAVVVAALLTVPAQAAPLLIDFESDPPGAPQNFTLHGMRFSPLCGVHIENFPVGRYASVESAERLRFRNQPQFFRRACGRPSVYRPRRRVLFAIESGSKERRTPVPVERRIV